MRVGHAEIFVGIDWDIVYADFVVEVGTGTASAISDVTDGIAAVNVLTREDSETFQMAVACGDTVTMIENNGTAIAAHEVGKLNYAFRRSHDRLSVKGADINSGVKSTFAIKWVDAFAE